MLPEKQPNPFFSFSLPEQFDGKNDHAEDKHKKTNTVNPMHVPNPFRFRLIRFSEVEVL